MKQSQTKLKHYLEEEFYRSPQCQILHLQMENILCQSLPEDNIGNWESDNDGREDLDSDW